MSDEDIDFLEYIKQTLVPDLIVAGQIATANDIHRLLNITNSLLAIILKEGIKHV